MLKSRPAGAQPIEAGLIRYCVSNPGTFMSLIPITTRLGIKCPGKGLDSQ